MYITGRMMGEGPGFRTTALRGAEAIGLAIAAALPEIGLGTVAFGTTTYATLLGGAVLTAGTIGVSQVVGALLAPKLGSSAQTAAANQITIRQSLPTRKRSYGQIKIAGAVGFEEVDGGVVFDTVTYAQNFWLQQLTGQGEIDAVTEHWLADDQVLIGGPGIFLNWVITGKWFPGSLQQVYIRSKLGAIDQTAMEELVEVFGPDYTTDHRWAGVPNTLLSFVAPTTAAIAQALYPSGPPNYRQVQRSALLYDPRNGTQIADGDPDRPRDSNWAFSDLAGLVLLDYLRHPDGYNRKRIGDARAMLPIAKFRVADWIAFTNTCDEDVPRKGGGTEKRWRLAGTYDMTTPPKQVLQGMLDACDAELYRHKDGTIGIRGGAWTEATATIDDSIKPGVIEHSLKRGQGKNAACNIINAKYTSARHDYQQVDMDTWIDQDNIDLRGEELPVDLDLSWSPSHGQARRIAKIQMHKRNPQWMGTLVAGPAGLTAFNQRILRCVVDDLGIDQSFLMTSYAPVETLERTTIGIASFGSEAYDWNAELEEGTRPAVSVVTMADSTVPVPTDVEAEVIFDPAVGDFIMRASFANTSGFTLYFEAQYEETGAGPDAWLDVNVPDDALAGQTDGPVDRTLEYDAQVRSITPAGKASLWAAPDDVFYQLVDDAGNALFDDASHPILNEV